MKKSQKIAVASFLNRLTQEEDDTVIREIVISNLPSIRQLIGSRRSNIDRITEGFISSGIAGTKKQIKAIIIELLTSTDRVHDDVSLNGQASQQEHLDLTASSGITQDRGVSSPTIVVADGTVEVATVDRSTLTGLLPVSSENTDRERPARTNRRPPELDKTTTKN